MSIEISGADELAGFLKEMATMDDVKEAVKINTSEMQRQAMRNTSIFTAPTGNLKRLIEVDFKDGGFTGVVTSTAAYSGYPEYGTRHMSARPYFRPAWHKQELQYSKDMSRLMDKR